MLEIPTDKAGEELGLPRKVHQPISAGDELEGIFQVEAMLKHPYRQGYQFLTKWKHYAITESTWEPLKHDQAINQLLREYCQSHNLHKAYQSAFALSARREQG